MNMSALKRDLGVCALPGGKASALSLKRFSVQLQIIVCMKEAGRERGGEGAGGWEQ